MRNWQDTFSKWRTMKLIAFEAEDAIEVVAEGIAVPCVCQWYPPASSGRQPRRNGVH